MTREARSPRPAAAPDWLPLYLVLLGAATLAPFWHHCAQQPWARGPGLADVVQNVVLFVPLGLATRGRPLPMALVLAAALSGAIESAQRWLPRNPDAWDVAANVAGTVLGRALPPWRGLSGALRGAVPLTGLAAAALLGVLAWPHPGPPNDFSNWAPHPLVLGDEADGTRPWRGTLAELAIYDRAVAGDAFQDGRVPEGEHAEPTWDAGGPVLWIRFAPPLAGRLDGPQGPRPLVLPPLPDRGFTLAADGLHIAGQGPWRLPAAWAAHVRERLRAAGRATLAARFRTADLEQTGPARIASISRDPGHRALTLAQDGHELTFRVRTPAVGPNGVYPHAETFDAGLTTTEHRVTASFDGQTSRIVLDGSCRGDALIALARAQGPYGASVGLTIAACVALTALAARAWVSRRRSRWTSLGAALLCGGVALLTLRGAGTWSHIPDFEPWALGLGVAAVLGSLRVGLGRRGSGSTPGVS